MNNDLFRNSTDPEMWKLCAEAFAADLAAANIEGTRRRPSATLPERDAEMERAQALEPVRKLFSMAANAQWPAHRRSLTLGGVDADVLALACENRIIGWQEAFTAKAMFGAPEDLEVLERGAQLAGSTLNYTNALVAAARPQLLVAGLRHEGNAATVEQLFRMGADPNYDNGTLFKDVVEQGRADIGRIFARFGQDGILNVETWVNWAKANRKLKLFDDLKKIYWEYGRFSALDNETLLETKKLPDNAGTLRILFNFSARRVTETLETPNPRQLTQKDYSFDEYGERALEAAREKLIEMGAKPSGVEIPLRGKTVVARPAGLGLPGKKG